MIAFFALALASKENAVALPALLFGWLALVRKEGGARAFKATLPLWVMSAAFLLFAVYVLRRGPGLPPFQLKNSLLALAQYSRLLFLPFDLNAERGLVTAFDIAGPVLMGGLFYYFYRARRFDGLYAVFWMLVCLVPFLDMRFVTGRPIAEQRLYMAVLGLGFSAGALYEPVLARRIAVGAAAVIFGAFSAARNFDWIDPVRFWEKTAAASPESARAHNNLGVSYERVRRFQDALVQYEKAADLDLSGAASYLNLADLLYKGGRREDAAAIYDRVYSKEPSDKRASLGLMRIKLEAGDLDGAEKLVKALLEAAPANPEALNSLGVIEMARGRGGAALPHFEKALAANPEYADALYNMAALFQGGGNYAGAAGAYERLLLIEPFHPDALNNLAIIKDMGGDEAGAIELFKRNEQANPRFYKSAYNLGGIYYRKKMYLEALGEFTRVLDIFPGHEGARRKADESRGRLDGTVKK